MAEKSFLTRMYESLCREEELENAREEGRAMASEALTEAKKILAEQEEITVHVMDSEMEDFFYRVGVNDFLGFLNKLIAGDFCYTEGGMFGAEGTVVNKGKPDWMQMFMPLVKSPKSGKTVRTPYFIDSTNPMESAKEAVGIIGQRYPDLIVNL